MYLFKHTNILLFFMLLFSTVILVGCGDESKPGIDGDTEIIDCVNGDQCPSGYVCNFTTNLCEKTDGGDEDAVDSDPDSDLVEEDQDIIYTHQCPVIIISPDQLDFAAVSLGSTAERSFTILNDSNIDVDLIIDAIYYDEIMQTEEFQIIQQPEEYPHVLARGQSTTIKVKYSPFDPGKDEADILIVSNACENFVAKVHLFSFQCKSTFGVK